MFITGQSVYAGIIFSLLSFLVAIPSAVKVFNWTATLYKGKIYLRTPMLYALGFIGLFTIGGLTGLALATLGLDVHVHDTYFIIAHFHYIMVGGAVMGFLGGIHFWWPKITGRLYPEFWGKLSAMIVFVGFNLTFFPQFILGYLGHAAALLHLSSGVSGAEHVLSSAGASGSWASDISCRSCICSGRLSTARKRGNNPWQATGLEWQIASPPPTENFDVTPTVTRRCVRIFEKMPGEPIS